MNHNSTSWRGATSGFLSPCPCLPSRTHHVEDPQGHCCCLDVEAAAFGGLRGGLGGHFRVPLSTPGLMRPNLQPPHGKRSESSSASFLLSECVKSSTKSHEAFGFLNHKESRTGGLLEHIQPQRCSGVQHGGARRGGTGAGRGFALQKSSAAKAGPRNFTSNSPCCFCSRASKFLPLDLPAKAPFPGSAPGSDAGAALGSVRRRQRC